MSFSLNPIIKEMKYDLPKNKEEFLERYRIRERLFLSEYNQYSVKSYSGLNNARYGIDNNLNDYLENSNLNLSDNWEKELESQIYNFGKSICYDEQLLQKGCFSSKATVYEE